ncbi:outer membrane beta-barrel family protein [Flavobacterium sp. '19STA2R22 D10 B1']|uniref:outer membrane beta-barrel family protein n=1 Tax=Flavobacterium aerium TaxID=3037261 RepID=UPI00278C4A50|nr:outer membrane beta-barrel family protein [Flavobacterium sp. '19STA2R22 D10 B1']
MQAQGSRVSGQVTDENNTPQDFVEVHFYQNDILKNLSLTNEKGIFKTSLKNGSYTISVYKLNQIIYSSEISLKSDLNLGILKLTKNIELNEVLVQREQKRFESKTDRLIFNVENSISSSGGDALDLIKIIPGVRVQSSAISIIGKSDVRVMVDERLIQLSGEELNTYLRSLSSDNIKTIELITTPPAKYDAEGNSGLINIIMKTTVKDSWQSTLQSTYIQTTYSALLSNANFNYQKDRFGFLIDIGAKQGSEAALETIDTKFPTQQWEGDIRRKDRKEFIRGRIGMNYQLTEKSTIGMEYFGGSFNPNSTDANTIKMSNRFTNVPEGLNSTFGQNDKDNYRHSINLNFVHTIDTLGKNISIDVDYFKYNITQSRDFTSRNTTFNTPNASDLFLEANNSSLQNINNYSTKVDINYPLESIEINFGVKFSFTNNNNTIDFKNINSSPNVEPSQHDDFDYHENTQAVYLGAKKTLNKQWTFQAGIRLESTQNKSLSKFTNEEFSNDYLRLFPTVYVSYTLNEKNTFNLNYNRRINRPSYWGLNPFRWYFNIYTFTEGNPFLQPSYTDKIEISHNYKNKLISNIYLTKETNGMSQLPIIDVATNTTLLKMDNFYTQYNYGISETFIYNTIPWLQSYNQVNLFYCDTQLEKETNSRSFSGMCYYFSTNNSINLNPSKSWQGEVNFWYNAPFKALIGEFKSTSSFDMGLKYNLTKNNLLFKLTVFDILKTNKPQQTTYTNNVEQTKSIYFDERSFRFSLIYKLGSKKTKHSQREFGNKEETNRAE